ncbi:MAG: efflux RND transporter periplasmic adaptor subunit [Hyphomicrobiaceae bacterium]
MNMQHRKAKDEPVLTEVRPLSEHQQASRSDEQTHPASGGGMSTGLFVRVLRGLAKVVLPLVILASAFAGYSYLKATKPIAPKRAQAERVYAVKVVTAQVASHQPTLTLYGSTVSGRQVDIRALVSGRVVATGDDLREGGEIAKGDMLIEIDLFDFKVSINEANAQLAEAKARKIELQASLKTEQSSIKFAKEQLKIAKRDLERARPLVKRGALSKQALEQRQNIVSQREQAVTAVENTFAVWQARIAQQDATITRLEQTVALANRRLTETKLVAPFNAYITNIATQTGRTVTANDTIATLIDRDWIEARFVLTNEQYGRIVSADGSLVGRPVKVNWVLGEARFTYEAEIIQVGAQISSATGGVEVFARIHNSSKPAPLRPGAFVEVTLPDRKFDNVVKIPAVALYDGDTVYTVVQDRLQPREVEVVGGSDGDLLVRGELRTGAKIITTRLSKPGQGVRVQLSETSP